MLSFIKKQWFLLAIAGAGVTGYLWPEWGKSLKNYDIFTVGIILSFFATGLCLETQSMLRQVKDIKGPVVALLSSLILYPFLAWALASQILPTEFVVGVCLIGAAPVTISSGTIMTAVAGGNIPLSLIICILTNFLAIFTMPVMLNVLLNLGTSINLPTMSMIGGLVVKVLLPLLFGQLMRPMMKNLTRRYANQISIFQALIIILIIFNAISSSADKLDESGSSVAGVAIFIISFHFLMLLLNYRIARAIKLDRPSTIAFTIHTSQKTLAVSYIVWSGYFAVEYPTAFIPAIVCQLTQMTVGTFVAEFFKKRSRP